MSLHAHSFKMAWPPRLQTTVSCVIVCLLLFLFLVWRLKSIYSATYPLYNWSTYVPLPSWVALITALRWPLRITALLTALMAALIELNVGSFSSMLHASLKSRWMTVFTLGLVGFLSGSYFLLPGHIAGSTDAEAYTGFAALVRESLRMGQWPIWTNYGGMGTPLLQFYSSLYLGLVALVGLIQNDLFEATKFAQYALHLLSVFGIYCWVCRLSGSRPAAFVSAGVYGLAFYRYHAIVYVGLLHVGLIFALLPWQFYFEELFLQQSSWRPGWCGLTLLSGLLLLSHPHYGPIAIAFGVLYGLLRLWTMPASWSMGDKILASGLMFVSVLGGGLIGCSPFIAVFTEGRYVSFGKNLLPTGFDLGTLQLSQVFTFRDSFLSGKWFGGYIGVSVTLFAVLAWVAAMWKRIWAGISVGLLFTVTLYLTLGPGHFPFDAIFQAIPFGRVVYVFDTPGRYLVFVTFFGAAAAGLFTIDLAGLLDGVYCRFGITGRKYPEQAALIVLFIVSVDMVPLLMQTNSLRPPTYWTVQGRSEAYAWLQAHVADSNARALQPELSRPDTHLYLYANRPSFNSTNHEIPIFAARLIDHLQDVVRSDLAAGHFRPLTLDWLYMTNTAAIVTGLPTTGDAAAAADFDNAKYTVFVVNAHSAILASPALKIAADTEDVNGLLAGMQLNRSRNSAAFIPVFNDLPSLPHSPPEPVEVRVVSHTLEAQRVILTYELSAPAYVQLSYAYYPYLAVNVDGKRAPVAQSVFGLIVFFSEGGTHTVELKPYIPTGRQGLNVAIFAYLFVVAGVTAYPLVRLFKGAIRG